MVSSTINPQRIRAERNRATKAAAAPRKAKVGAPRRGSENVRTKVRRALVKGDAATLSQHVWGRAGTDPLTFLRNVMNGQPVKRTDNQGKQHNVHPTLTDRLQAAAILTEIIATTADRERTRQSTGAPAPTTEAPSGEPMDWMS